MAFDFDVCSAAAQGVPGEDRSTKHSAQPARVLDRRTALPCSVRRAHRGRSFSVPAGRTRRLWGLAIVPIPTGGMAKSGEIPSTGRVHSSRPKIGNSLGSKPRLVGGSCTATRIQKFEVKEHTYMRPRPGDGC
ncbi:uncharacterized protein LOC100251634 [Anopheles sinensis]|uniref:Uncharacterized protein LOC100251634 n=1 Tax=Anopheles sinensis TaxID=74873 RepID=A0A084WI37_ANOSI|nr:uncharacterized protein LOC100251634 [Anopheles sinensis]